MQAMFRDDFGTRLLPFDAAAARAYAEVAALRRQAGRPIAQYDAQIAATAISRDCGLVTRNTADFDGCGLPLHNPWQHGN